MTQKRFALIINFLNLKISNVSVWSRSRLELFLPGTEPTNSGRSRLRDLGLPEPEPPKKVAAPQHCLLQTKPRDFIF